MSISPVPSPTSATPPPAANTPAGPAAASAAITSEQLAAFAKILNAGPDEKPSGSLTADAAAENSLAPAWMPLLSSGATKSIAADGPQPEVALDRLDRFGSAESPEEPALGLPPAAELPPSHGTPVQLVPHALFPTPPPPADSPAKPAAGSGLPGATEIPQNTGAMAPQPSDATTIAVPAPTGNGSFPSTPSFSPTAAAQPVTTAPAPAGVDAIPAASVGSGLPANAASDGPDQAAVKDAGRLPAASAVQLAPDSVPLREDREAVLPLVPQQAAQPSAGTSGNGSGGPGLGTPQTAMFSPGSGAVTAEQFLRYAAATIGSIQTTTGTFEAVIRPDILAATTLRVSNENGLLTVTLSSSSIESLGILHSTVPQLERMLFGNRRPGRRGSVEILNQSEVPNAPLSRYQRDASEDAPE